MAIYDTIANQRTEYTEKSLASLLETVDFNKYKLDIIDNDSCQDTKELLIKFKQQFEDSFNPSNLWIYTSEYNKGTAKAINLSIAKRDKDTSICKVDNDVVFDTKNWLDILVTVATRVPDIGICAAKRNDLGQSPLSPNPEWRTELHMCPHNQSEPWIVYETCTSDVMGTVCLYTSRLLDKTNFLWQSDVYAWEDIEISYRAQVAGFRNCFVPANITIHHIDRGDNEYVQVKRDIAAKSGQQLQERLKQLFAGELPVWQDFY